jgi:hypothetical protein
MTTEDMPLETIPRRIIEKQNQSFAHPQSAHVVKLMAIGRIATSV